MMLITEGRCCSVHPTIFQLSQERMRCIALGVEPLRYTREKLDLILKKKVDRFQNLLKVPTFADDSGEWHAGYR